MKVRKIILIDMFMILVMLSPTSISEAYLPYSSYAFMILQLYIGYNFCRLYGGLKREKESILLLLFFLIAFLGMFVNYGIGIKGIMRFICWCVSVIGLYMFIGSASDERIQIFLEASRSLYVIGAVLTLLFGLGMTENMAYGTNIFFWGSEAVTAQVFLTFFVMSIYYDIRYISKISLFSIIMGGLSVLFCIYYNSGQGISMFAVFIILMSFNKICSERLWRIITPMIVLVVISALYYLVITLRFTEINFVVNYITNVLSKEVSLTGRDAIFEGALKIFSEHRWIGYGYNNAIINDVLGKVAMQFNTAHNSMLQMLVDYGMIGTGVFVTLVYSWMKSMYNSVEMEHKIIYFAVIAMFVGGLVNMMIPTNCFWLLVMLGISSNNRRGMV